MKIVKGDTVLVIAGKDKAKKGVVERTVEATGKVIVGKINMQKKHMKPSRKNPKGGIMEFAAALNSSNVVLVCPKCEKPTRVGYMISAAGKERMCKKCKKAINFVGKKG